MATDKFKRLSSITAALCIAFSVFAVILTASRSVVGVRAATSDKLAGYNYGIEYLLKDFGLEKIDGETTYFGGRTVEYRLTKLDGVAVAENDENYSEATKKEIVSSDSDVKFLCVGAEYTFTVTAAADPSDVQSFTVETFASFDDVAITYKNDLSAFQTALDEYAGTLKTNDSFKFSEVGATISEIAAAKYFDIENMKVVVCYYAPGSMSYSTASGSKLSDVSFTLTKAGEYGFYFEFTDSLNNTTNVEELVLGSGGYYIDADGNGEFEAGVDVDMVVPVFTFTISSVSKPEVVVGTSEDAFLGLDYEISCFTITASEYTPVYELYYIDKAEALKKADFDNEEAYIDAVKEKAIDVSSILSESGTSFKPTIDEELKTGKGYYYVLLSIYDENGYTEKVMSREIECVEEYQEVVPEKQFFKYNVLSIVFLSIAAASFIAIIVLFFIRPKKENELEVKA